MTTGIILFAIFAIALLTSAIVWTIRLANTVPAMQDMMPILPGEQLFIVSARKRSDRD